MDEVVKAYAAGLVDGEGCIGVYGTRKGSETRAAQYQLTVRICMKNPGPILFIAKHFKGALATTKRLKGTQYEATYQIWHARGLAGEDFLKEILPYLIEKKAQAELALEFCMFRRGQRVSHARSKRYPHDVLVSYQDYVDKLKALKKSA